MSERLPQLYDDPALYDLIHDDGTDDEVWLLDHLAKRHGNGGKHALEPACGTGRYLEGLLRRGWSVLGYDLSAKMVGYAKKRLSKYGARAEVVKGDMTTFRPKKKYDVAFNLLSTFRHLMTDKDALAHFRVSAEALSSGGIYILGLDLADYGREFPDEETWTVRRGGRTVRHVMETIPAQAGARRERIVNFVIEAKGRRERLVESAYDLRSYDARELAELLHASPFQLAAAYGYDGRPAELGGAERALWLVLRAKTA